MPNTNNYIYIIDGDASARRSLERLITSFDINVLAFTNIIDFQTTVPSINNACLLIDIDTIKDIDDFKDFLDTFGNNFHIIVTTADSNEKARKIAVKINASMCLQKPIDAQALLDLIKWSFGNQQVTAN